jgi:transglutaminase-like putative cysteine protease
MEHFKTGYPAPGPEYLKPTAFFDFDKPAVRAFAERNAAGASTDIEKAVKLYYAVRDQVRYDPYKIVLDPKCYSASQVIADMAAFCLPKASLLVAAARAVGIPTAIGTSDVRNHLCTERLLRVMGGRNLFIHHGYAVMYLAGKWVKAAPAFNIELCNRFDVLPTEFDGTSDALFQQYDKRGRRHMDYVAHHGVWSDFPYERIERDFRAYYPASFHDDIAREAALRDQGAAPKFEDEKPLLA